METSLGTYNLPKKKNQRKDWTSIVRVHCCVDWNGYENKKWKKKRNLELNLEQVFPFQEKLTDFCHNDSSYGC